MRFLLICFIVLIDQISKNYIYQNKVQYDNIVSVIEGILNFTYVENTGIAFGIFSDFDGLKVVFIVVPILITLYLFSLLNNKEFQNPFSHISLLLIISGAIGNIIDRIFRGYVIDFIQFDIDIFPYIFNIADSSVTIGLLLLLYSSIIVQRR
ncbi:MAG: lipoprotein signal peptidase [Candidatus Neomarinimicrobiota bacterium]|nr:MAG: lipoprotein signal peptidase [Candidatus Neomarinimicrobiota bacterium]|tara:strand:- start:708 stop:1163 length:456 start_codon:yes stop_codon:yes gene_type:complete